MNEMMNHAAVIDHGSWQLLVTQGCVAVGSRWVSGSVVSGPLGVEINRCAR